ncbi:hypothetical protein ACWDZ8_32785 [Streptomyces sp. NPDC003233]
MPDARIREALGASTAPGDVVRALITAADEAGGPDNVSCVVADVMQAAA